MTDKYIKMLVKKTDGNHCTSPQTLKILLEKNVILCLSAVTNVRMRAFQPEYNLRQTKKNAAENLINFVNKKI